jgi:hypothetical protein
MTAGIVAVLSSEIVMVADSMCLDGATGAAVAEAAKLFIHDGRAAIFSWGCGPADVQDKVRSLETAEARPKVLARALREIFRAVSSPYRFGVYVGGFDEAMPSLWHVDVPASDCDIQDRSAIGRIWPVCPPDTAEALTAWLSLNGSMDPLSLGVGFVQKAHALTPNKVGADARGIRVTVRCAEWV